ncbi:MAG: DoxX family membrane protein [Bryobacteraceae bacterium]|nr:DoxX family membrane protein [Bryobacteraceae bacterium]
MSQGPAEAARSLEGWRTWAAAACSLLLALLFLVAGLWKLSDPFATEARMTQALIPKPLAMPVALLAGIGETWIGVLLLVPRWRRWGAWLAAAALVVFMAYFGIFYNQLRGADCSCFPWLKRVVGVEFFVSDALMLAAALLGAAWSARSTHWKQASMALGVIIVMALAIYGATLTQRGGVQAPEQIVVDGKPFALREGRVLLFFFDPECSHCFQSAKELATLDWNGARVVVVPTVNPQWATAFLRDTGLRAGVSFDVMKLRQTFRFTDPPYAVALEDGRVRKEFTFAGGEDAPAALRQLGWIR